MPYRKWNEMAKKINHGRLAMSRQVKIRIFSQPISSLGVAQSTVGDLYDLMHYLILCDYSFTDLFRAIKFE